MMESPMTRNCHVGFGERYEETRQLRSWKVRFVPTPFSPLLANIALDGMIRDLMAKYPQNKTIKGVKHQKYQPRIVRYADDFVVLHNDYNVIRECKKLISEWLEKVGLRLKPEKTRICHTLNKIEVNGEQVEAGFDFLGFHIRSYPVGKHNSGKKSNKKLLGFKTLIKPSKKSIKAPNRSCQKGN